jgi:hypothetical protein
MVMSENRVDVVTRDMTDSVRAVNLMSHSIPVTI